MVTERVGEGVAFMPFHFGGHLEGKDLRDKYPKGSDPYVLGESSNTVQTYGYDSVTQMQETKCTPCVRSSQHNKRCRPWHLKDKQEQNSFATPSAASNVMPA